MKLHYCEYGQGPPLIILHGLFGSHENWHSVSQRLAEQRRVFALDLRNHGQSPHADAMDFDVMAEDVAGFCRDHALSGVGVMGHSLGGKVAMQFALTNPDLAAQLVVVDIAPRAYGSVHSDITTALLAVDLKPLRSRREVDELLAPSIPEVAVRRFLLKNLGQDAAGALHWKLNLRAIAGNREALRAAVDGGSPFMRPTLFIRGGKSDYLSETDHADILRWFPRAEIRTLASAGHWVHAEAPDEFVELVSTFLVRTNLA